MRVLYIEDNAADADLARRHFARHAPDIALTLCATCQAARDHLHDSTPATPAFDLVLADMHLPDGDGMSILAEIRARALPIAVVVVTGGGSETIAVAALKAGADDYIVKRENYLRQLPTALRHTLRRFEKNQGRYRRTLRVLYAEHHTVDVDLTLRHMHRHAPHIQLEVVHTATDALARLLAADALQRYHVLLMDYRLPGMNALDLIKELELHDRQDIPVVLVTGQGDEEIAAQALRLGVADYVVKNQGYLQQLPHTLENVYNNAMLQRERAALHASEQRYRTLLEFAPVGIYTMNIQGQFTGANALIQHRFGLQSETDFLGKTIFEIAPPELATQIDTGVQAAITTRQMQTGEERQAAGDEEQVYLTRKAPLFDAQGRLSGIMGVCIDVTERLKIEEARRADEERFLQLAEHIDQVFWLQDVKTRRLLYISPAFEKVYGIPCDQAYANPDVVINAVDLADRSQTLSLTDSVRAGTPAETEFRLRRPDGSLVWAVGQIFPIKDEQGEVVRVAGLVRDVTERRRNAEHVQQQARLAAVGQMAAGIAHDFNNILAVITLYTQMLQLSAQSSLQQRQLNTIFQQAQHASDLVQQILDFSRRSPLERTNLAMHSFLGELVKLWRRTLPETIELVYDIAKKPLVISADPARLQQALMNIVFNARDAMIDGGTLTITAKKLQLTPDLSPPMPALEPGNWLQLTFTDSGPGVPAEVLPHIFEPFFTTKEPGRGTGLGLAQVFGIVRQLGGQITVHNNPGASFTIFLPLLDTSETETDSHRQEIVRGGGETILLVEDEVALREAIHEMLLKLGYRVIQAGDGNAALATFTAHAETIDLILGDLVMPELGGLGFRQELLKRIDQAPAPQQAVVPMVLMTGYPVESPALLHRQYRIDHVLQKPFTLDRLAEVLSQALAPDGQTHNQPPTDSST